MHRSHTCGELRSEHIGSEVTLSGWVQRGRDLGGMTFIDLRDRYGMTQLAFNLEVNKELCMKARSLGREFVIKVKGKVAERESKNKNMPTGDVEIIVSSLEVLNSSKTPPFTITATWIFADKKCAVIWSCATAFPSKQENLWMSKVFSK
jgi:aspartyl-tRNA synthetase